MEGATYLLVSLGGGPSLFPGIIVQEHEGGINKEGESVDPDLIGGVWSGI